MGRRPPTVFTHLELEWEHLVASRRLDRALVRWQSDNAELTEFRDVDHLIALLADHDVSDGRQNEVLLALLRLAPDDPLAARLVLERFMAPLRTMAGWTQPFPQGDWAASVVSAAYEVIVTYPVESRTARVGANIVWEVRKLLYTSLADHRRWEREVSTGDTDDRVVVGDMEAGVEAAELLRWAAARSDVPRDVAALIVLTRLAGVQVVEIAARCGVPSSRLRQQRWRSEHRMRDVLTAAS